MPVLRTSLFISNILHTPPYGRLMWSTLTCQRSGKRRLVAAIN
jgi:hypothetical protein